MNINKLRSISLWKDSIGISIGVLAVIETILAIADFSTGDIWKTSWYIRLGVIVLVFILLCFTIAWNLSYKANKSISLKIRGIKVIIKEGDIFQTGGWKLIPLNEFFDTQVDDVVIAKNTLNGKYIMEYVQNIDDLKNAIKETKDTTSLKHTLKNGRKNFPLGRIITYKDYMLLAFSRFVENQAYLTHSEYEQCLRTMWQEISRTYANQPVTIPLLGSGITRFEHISEKNNTHLLRCILCTLKTSTVQINQPITIVLTKETLDNINLYDLKKMF